MKKVLVDIDKFKEDLGYRIGESDDEKWSAEYMFETIANDAGEPMTQLKVEGIDQIMQPSLDILEDLHYDQTKLKPTHLVDLKLVVQDGDQIEQLIGTALDVVVVPTVNCVVLTFNECKLFINRKSSFESAMSEYQEKFNKQHKK